MEVCNIDRGGGYWAAPFPGRCDHPMISQARMLPRPGPSTSWADGGARRVRMEDDRTEVALLPEPFDGLLGGGDVGVGGNTQGLTPWARATPIPLSCSYYIKIFRRHFL